MQVNSTSNIGALHNAWPQGGAHACPLHTLKCIIPHYSYNVLEIHPRFMHRTWKWWPMALQLASRPQETVLTTLRTVHSQKNEDPERNRCFSSLCFRGINLFFLTIPVKLWEMEPVSYTEDFRGLFKVLKVLVTFWREQSTLELHAQNCTEHK